MQAAARLKGALTTASTSSKSPVEVSAAAVDALRIATSRRMLVIFLWFSIEVDGGCGVGIFDARDHCARVARAAMLVQPERHQKITCTVLQQQDVAQSWPSCCCKAPASAPPRRDDARLETPNEPRASSGGDQQAENASVDLASTLRSMRGARSAAWLREV